MGIGVSKYMEMRMSQFRYTLEQFFDDVTPGSRGDHWTWNDEFHELTNDPAHAERLQDLIADIKANGIKEPVVIGTDNRCWDGHHRVVAAIHLGMKWVPVVYANRGERDMF